LLQREKRRKVSYLRAATFNEKSGDPSKPVDYGLLAEEVATVYPDLVVRGADGQVQTVQYQKLTPMLINELQKQQQQLIGLNLYVQQQNETIEKLEARLAALEVRLVSAPPGKQSSH
jgi:hypothetical protein